MYVPMLWKLKCGSLLVSFVIAFLMIQDKARIFKKLPTPPR